MPTARARSQPHKRDVAAVQCPGYGARGVLDDLHSRLHGLGTLREVVGARFLLWHVHHPKRVLRVIVRVCVAGNGALAALATGGVVAPAHVPVHQREVRLLHDAVLERSTHVRRSVLFQPENNDPRRRVVQLVTRPYPVPGPQPKELAHEAGAAGLFRKARVGLVAVLVELEVEHRVERLVHHEHLLIPEHHAKLLLPEPQLHRRELTRLGPVLHHRVGEESNLVKAPRCRGNVPLAGGERVHHALLLMLAVPKVA
mmetsp:Transcript_11868/g.35988  ORF Transcript_11868/g.35988 Transcript_11868/m.35988 type:complete len:256 (+) Transcript_11868:264-1031(+)